MRNLILSDAVDGQCFKLRFIFSAVSPADRYLMAGTADTMDLIGPEVTATAHTVFCAENKRTFTVAKQPSTGETIDQAIAQDTVLSQPPRVRSSTPLPSVELRTANGSSQLSYYIPRGADVGIRGVQLVPTATGPEVVEPCKRGWYGGQMLDGAACSFFRSGALAGGCTDHTASLVPSGDSGATQTVHLGINVGLAQGSTRAAVTSGSKEFVNPTNISAWQIMQPPLYGRLVDPLMDGLTPALLEEFSFDQFKWRQTIPDKGSALTVGVTSVSGVGADVFDEASIFPEMIFESTPATVQLITQPPKRVVVGVPFFMSARILISSGAPLRGVTLGAILSPSEGTAVGPYQYILDQFRITAASDSGDTPPALEADSATSVSNRFGVARFVLVLKAGATGVSRTLQFVAGKATSKRTHAFIIENPMQIINASKPEDANWPSRVGQDAIGSPYTMRLGELGLIESFPVVIPIGFPILVNISLNPYLSAHGISVDESALAEMFSFRVYTKESLTQMAGGQAALDQQMAGNQAALDQLAADASAAGDTLLNTATNLAEDVATVFDSAATNCSEPSVKGLVRGVSDGLTDIEYAQLESLANSILNVASGPGMVSSFFNLFTSGSTPQVEPPTPTNMAEVQPTYNVSRVDESTFVIHGVVVYVRSPATLHLQVDIAGVASNLFGEIVVDQYDAASASSTATKYAFQFLMTAFICFMAFGNSDWHRPLPLPLLISMALTCWGLGSVYVLDYPVGRGLDAGTWWLIDYSVIILGAQLPPPSRQLHTSCCI